MLCDYLLVEERLEWGRSVVRSGMFALVDSTPGERDGFDEDDKDTNPDGRTVVGPLLGAVRRPARPTP